MSKTVAANRQARLMAVQALYQHAFRGQNAPAILQEFIEAWLTPTTNRSLFVHLVQTAIRDKEALDGMIRPLLSSGWTLERLDPVVLAVLRVGAAELHSQPDSPAKVLIFDYVLLAKTFFDQKEPAFVNQLLDTLTRTLRPGELPERV